MKKSNGRGFLKPYKSYVFRNKDPVIDVVRTAVQDSGISERQISEASGVSQTAMAGWFRGATRRPQFATVTAVMSALGKEPHWINKRK